MERIGDRVFKLMKAKGFSQKQLACLVGVTEAAMSRYLNNDREPKIDVVARIAIALHTTTDYLITGQEKPSDFDEVYNVLTRNVGKMNNAEKVLLIEAIVLNDK